MKIQMGYTNDNGSLISRIIRFFTRGDKSHVMVVFTLKENEWQWFMERFAYRFPVDFMIAPDHDGLYRIYFESIWKIDARTFKTGVRGPYPLEKVMKWTDQKKNERQFELQDVCGLTEQEMRETIARCVNYVGLLEYAPIQLFWNLKTLRSGKARPYRRRTSKFVTCVEFAIVVLPGRYSIDYLNHHYLTAEEYVPTSDRITGLGLRELIDDANRIISIQEEMKK